MQQLKNFAPANWPDWKFFGMAPSGDHISAPESYAAVPFVFNAVNHIAGSLSTLPYVIERGEEDVTSDFSPVAFSDFLYLYASWQLLFGASYFKPSRNTYGAAQWAGLFPGNMRPVYANGELTRFEFNGTPRQTFQANDPQLIWQWWPNNSTAEGPGAYPAMVALGDANLLYRLGQFVTAYMLRGGPLTLLTVEGNPQQDQLDKVEAWWARATSGIRSFFKGIAIRATMKPVTFGSSIKDSTSAEVQQQARENVVIAFNLPMTVVMSNYASYATADMDALMKYENAVMPLARRIGDKLNEKIFMPRGVKLRWDEQALPVYQSRFLQLSTSVLGLVQGDIIDKNEARVMLGKQPRPTRVYLPGEAAPMVDGQPVAEAGKADAPQVNSVLTNLTGTQQINLSRIIRKFGKGQLDEAQAVLLLTNGFGVTPDEARTLLGIGDTELPPQSAVASIELERWKRKALNAIERGKSASVQFTSDTIPATEHARITGALGACKTAEEVRAVFDSVPPGGDLARLASALEAATKALENAD